MKLTRRAFFGSVTAGAYCYHDMLRNTNNVWGQSGGGKKAYAVCVGLGHVNGDFYNGWEGQLSGTVPDAKLYYEDVIPDNFKKILLLDNEAKTRDLYRHVLWAANDLTSGDIFVLTIASHGMEVFDQSGDEKVNSPNDQYDEAWCLYDRPLLDDELGYMWSFFQPGVRIVLVVDSCHSGTSARNIPNLERFSKSVATVNINGLDVPAKARKRRSNDSKNENLINDQSANYLKDHFAKLADAKDLKAQVEAANQFKHIRAVPDILARALVEHDSRSHNIVSRGLVDMGVTGTENDSFQASTPSATVLTLAACRDDQSSMEDGSHGFFTSILAEVWNRGKFSGTYRQFFDQIRQEMRRAHGDAQIPFLDKFGPATGFIEKERPFAI